MDINIKEQIKWYAVYTSMASLHPNASIEDIVAYTNKYLNKNN